ncbi:MAG: hypothetical protein LBU65_01540 [Planctomycetaceae bacterium]|jgi:hypothetical protein|nr:hypothetical protein [Planctomycetaceae bacterium]
MTRSFLICFSFFVLLCLTGCGNGQVGLSGKVVFSDDGSPLNIGTICFSTPTFQARGEIKADGTFSMASFGKNDGLPPGTYQVGIIGATEDLGGDKIYSILDPKWNGPTTSGFSVTVDKTTKNLEIKVDRNPQSREDFQKKK